MRLIKCSNGSSSIKWASVAPYIWGTLLWLGMFILLADVQLGGDGMSYYAYVRSAVLDGDLNFYNEDGNFNPYRQPMTSYSARTATGYVHTQFAIGPAILWTPFFVLGHVWAGLSGIVQNGYTFPYVFMITASTAFYSTLGWLATYRLAEAHFNKSAALWASTSIWLGTAVTFYTFKDAAYSHPSSWFAVSILLHRWNQVRSEDYHLQGAALVGALVGLAALIRWQNVLFAVIPGFDILKQVWETAKRHRWAEVQNRVLGMVAMGGSALLLFTPQLLAWRIIYGDWIVIPQGQGFLRLLDAQILEVLFSPYHGLFVYTPLATLGAVGLVVLLKHRIWIGALLMAAVMLQVYVSSTVADWWAGYSFGMRRLVNCLPVLAIGLAALLHSLENHRAWRRIIFALIALLILWNITLVVEVGHRSWLDPEDRSWSFYTTAFKLVGTILREPTLLWRPFASYLPTLVAGLYRLDGVIIQSLLLIALVAAGVSFSTCPLFRLRGSTLLSALLASVVLVDGFILYSDKTTRQVRAVDLADTSTPVDPTTINNSRFYEGLLAQGRLAVDGNPHKIDIAGLPSSITRLEILWERIEGQPESQVVEVRVLDRLGSHVCIGRFDTKPALGTSPSQLLSRIIPYPTPMYVPYWLYPERFSLQQTSLYLSVIEFDVPVMPTEVSLAAVDKTSEAQVWVHALSWARTETDQ